MDLQPVDSENCEETMEGYLCGLEQLDEDCVSGNDLFELVACNVGA